MLPLAGRQHHRLVRSIQPRVFRRWRPPYPVGALLPGTGAAACAGQTGRGRQNLPRSLAAGGLPSTIARCQFAGRPGGEEETDHNCSDSRVGGGVQGDRQSGAQRQECGVPHRR
nr:hypothetical protein [Aeromonas hydrophila]